MVGNVLKPDKIEAIIFDLDGTLLYVVPEKAIELYRKLTFPYFSRDPLEIYEEVYPEWKKKLGHILNPSKRSTYLYLWCYCIKRDGSIEDIKEFAEKIQTTIEIEASEMYEDVVDILTKLKENGYTIGILSERTLVSIVRTLRRLSIDKFVDFYLSSSDIDKINGKGNPEIWSRITKFVDKPKENICYIGDDLKHDILPALQNGINALLIDRNDRFSNIDDIQINVINSLWELNNLLF